MLGELVTLQWQALIRFLRWSSQRKPSLVIAIGKRPKGNALEEYQRRFTPSAGEGYRVSYLPVTGNQDLPKPPPQQDRKRAKRPRQGEKRRPPAQPETRAPQQRDMRPEAEAKDSRSGGSVRVPGAVRGLMHIAMLRGYHGGAGMRLRTNGLIAVTAVCAVALGGAYIYRTIKGGGTGPIFASHVEQPSGEGAEKKGGRLNGAKLIYSRLTPNGPAPETPAQPSPSKLAGPGPDSRPDARLPEGKQPGNSPASSQTVTVQRQAANRRTFVRSETYSPDGTRIDVPRQAPVPSIVRLDARKARPPFLAAAQPPEAAAGSGPKEESGAPIAGVMEASRTP